MSSVRVRDGTREDAGYMMENAWSDIDFPYVYTARVASDVYPDAWVRTAAYYIWGKNGSRWQTAEEKERDNSYARLALARRPAGVALLTMGSRLRFRLLLRDDLPCDRRLVSRALLRHILQQHGDACNLECLNPLDIDEPDLSAAGFRPVEKEGLSAHGVALWSREAPSTLPGNIDTWVSGGTKHDAGKIIAHLDTGGADCSVVKVTIDESAVPERRANEEAGRIWMEKGCPRQSPDEQKGDYSAALARLAAFGTAIAVQTGTHVRIEILLRGEAPTSGCALIGELLEELIARHGKSHDIVYVEPPKSYEGALSRHNFTTPRDPTSKRLGDPLLTKHDVAVWSYQNPFQPKRQ